MAMDKGKALAWVAKGAVMLAANAVGVFLTTMFQTKPEEVVIEGEAVEVQPIEETPVEVSEPAE